jgi:hypothetical protein
MRKHNGSTPTSGKRPASAHESIAAKQTLTVWNWRFAASCRWPRKTRRCALRAQAAGVGCVEVAL